MSDEPREARSGRVRWLARMPYHDAGDIQRRVLNDRVHDRVPDTLLLVEHPPVFTTGRTARSEHWQRSRESLRSAGYEVADSTRGGSVTFHGPGQLVGYPILKLRNHCRGPKAYVHRLQDVLVAVLADWKIRACVRPEFPGVWVDTGHGVVEKIASIGVRITRGVTMHGFAVNANMDLAPFRWITPCGIENVTITSMEKCLGEPVEMEALRRSVTAHFGAAFGLTWVQDAVDQSGPAP